MSGFKSLTGMGLYVIVPLFTLCKAIQLGHKSVKDFRKWTCNNPIQHLPNIHVKACAKFGQIPSISQDTEQKQNFDINLRILTCNNPNLSRCCQCQCIYAKIGQIP